MPCGRAEDGRGCLRGSELGSPEAIRAQPGQLGRRLCRSHRNASPCPPHDTRTNLTLGLPASSLQGRGASYDCSRGRQSDQHGEGVACDRVSVSRHDQRGVVGAWSVGVCRFCGHHTGSCAFQSRRRLLKPSRDAERQVIRACDKSCLAPLCTPSRPSRATCPSLGFKQTHGVGAGSTRRLLQSQALHQA